MRAADDEGYCQCVSCGTNKHYKDMAGGHFIPKGASSYHALRLNECEEYGSNIHSQCHGCNSFGMVHGVAAQNYTLWMEDKYGKEKVEKMLADRRKLAKRYKGEMLDLIAELNEEIKSQKERLGEA
jgi:hypothetical protein|tara:strand:+ start:217 stop:594 length:378 start_codon:yes stop_codon:yes gene_type:complete